MRPSHLRAQYGETTLLASLLQYGMSRRLSAMLRLHGGLLGRLLSSLLLLSPGVAVQLRVLLRFGLLFRLDLLPLRLFLRTVMLEVVRPA